MLIKELALHEMRVKSLIQLYDWIELPWLSCRSAEGFAKHCHRQPGASTRGSDPKADTMSSAAFYTSDLLKGDSEKQNTLILSELT